MDYKTWANLFGEPADAAPVRSALANAGVTKKIKIGKDELSVSADIPGEGMSIGFRDESVLRSKSGGLIGRPILAWVRMSLHARDKKNVYQGPLPHGIDPGDNQLTLRNKLGAPPESSATHQWDKWHMQDGTVLTVAYRTDFASLNGISLSLPDN